MYGFLKHRKPNLLINYKNEKRSKRKLFYILCVWINTQGDKEEGREK